jgi:hypothetical protein
VGGAREPDFFTSAFLFFSANSARMYKLPYLCFE